MKIIALLSYPGAGKGTLAQSLDQDRYVTFSFGDVLRNEITKKSSLGNTYQNEIEMKGVQQVTLLPDDVATEIFMSKIKEVIQCMSRNQ